MRLRRARHRVAPVLAAVAAAAGVLGVLGVPGAALADGAGSPVPSTTLVSFRDDDVYESSGLVDRGRTLYTVNDSGDAAVVYGVDARTGATTSRSTYAGSVTDVEALAPGRHGTVWAGDIGDNRADRDDVAVYRLTPRDGRVPAARYRLRYPDGPRDAETLLVRPGTGRVLVVSKTVFGGTVYAAPRTLRAGGPAQVLRRFARVPGLVTDGTFLPDGRHVLLRTYGTASVYTFPGFDLVGTVRLPSQPQGEGISAASSGRVLVSSEGSHAEVLRVRLPVALLGSRPPGAEPAPSSRRPAEATGSGGTGPRRRDAGDWTSIGLVAAGVLGLGYLAARGSRIRGPRSR